MKPATPVVLLALVALLVSAACSSGAVTFDSGQGNVHVVLTGGSGSSLALDDGVAAAVAPGPAGAGQPSTLGHGHDDDDDDSDDDSEDDDERDGGNVLSQLDQANVTLSSLLARNLEGQLIDLEVELPQVVDLLTLMDGGSVELPTGTLPPDTYDQIVVVLTMLELVFPDGAKVALTPAGGGWTQILDVPPFTVVEGETTVIELRFNLQEAIRQIGSEFEFSPDLECFTD